MKLFFKKSVAFLMIYLTILLSFANCFGSFPLVRKSYSLVDSINFSNSWVSKIVKSIIVVIVFAAWWAGGIIFFLDLFIFNAYEFWTDKVLFSKADFDSTGKLVKSYEEKGEKIQFTYLDYGQKLVIDTKKDGVSDSIILLRNQPGKFFKKQQGILQEVKYEQITAGSKMILKMSSGDKTVSSKVVDKSEYEMIEKELLQKL